MSKVKTYYQIFKKLPTDYETKNKPYSNKEVAEMKAYMQENDPYLWSIVCFIYYGFLRPSELRRLRVGDVNIEARTITISSTQSETKKSATIPIAPALFSEIEKMQLKDYPSDNYLISGS